MTNKFCFLLFCLVYTCNVSGQEIENDIRKKINTLLKYEVDIDPDDTPGCVIGIIEVDTFFILPFGNMAGSREALAVDGIFDLGGMSKLVLSMIANNLLMEGVFSADDQLLSDFPQYKDADLGQISFMTLLQHRSGIKKVLIGLEAKTQLNGFVDKESFFDALEKTLLAKATKFQYSHHNYTLLSLWIEERTGQEIPQLIDQFYTNNPSLFRPELFYGKTKLLDINPGFSRGGKTESAEELGVQEYSLGLQSSMAEVIHWVQDFWMDEDNILAQKALSNRTDTEISRKVDFTQSFYVMGGEEDYTIYTHSGKSNRHSSAIHFVPETRTGVVIFSNSKIGTKDLSLLVLRMINYNWTRKADGQEEK